MSQDKGNDLVDERRNAVPVRANPPTSPTPTENTDIDEIWRNFWLEFPSNGTPSMFEMPPILKTAIEQKLNAEILKARDSEQNTLFSIMRHLHVKHDAKAIMRVRKEWDESAALQASKEGK